MRHAKKFNHLGRKKEHRDAMLSNMAISLILHKRINTTVAKAKALRSYVEPIITKAKDDSTHSRRVVFSYLNNKHAVSELFREVAQKVGERPGGYTRILKTGTRLGDSAEMCMIELVDYNENMLGGAADVKSKTRRSRRGSTKKKSDEVTAPAEAAETEVVEEVSEVVEEVPEVVEESKEVEEVEAKEEEKKEEESSEEKADEK